MLLDDPLDPRVREYAHLRAATLRLRAEGPDGARDGVFIAEGELVIERALALGYRMRSLLLLEQRLERFGRLAPEGVPVYAATERADALDHRLRGAPRRARLVRPQAAARASADLVRDARRVVVLEDVNNHTNVGAIVRSASALGIDALLLDPGSLRSALPPLAAHLDGRGAEPPPRAHRSRCRRAWPRCARRASCWPR